MCLLDVFSPVRRGPRFHSLAFLISVRTSEVDSSNLARTPALEPPAGVIPNFVNPESLTTVTVIVMTICISLATVGLGLRVTARFYIDRKLHWDDCGYLSVYDDTLGQMDLLTLVDACIASFV